MKTAETTSSNQSSEKLLNLLEFLSLQDEPLRLIDISQALNMNNSTASRFLATLVNMNYVAQEPISSKYYLTYKLCALGQQVKNHQQLPKTARPFLRELAQTVGETTCLGIDHNDQVVYIDVIEAPGQIVKAMQRIGNIAPLHCTGIGKLLLTKYSDSQLDEMIQKIGLTRFTDKTLTTKEALTAEIQRVRTNGYAFDDEECEIGTRCIAFPIYDYTGKIQAGFSVTGPSLRLTNDFFTQQIPYMKEISEKLSNLLGYQSLKNTF